MSRAHLSGSVSLLNPSPDPFSAATTWPISLPLFVYSCESCSSEHPSLLLCPRASYSFFWAQFKVLLNQHPCEWCSPDAPECSTCSAFHARTSAGLVSSLPSNKLLEGRTESDLFSCPSQHLHSSVACTDRSGEWSWLDVFSLPLAAFIF